MLWFNSRFQHLYRFWYFSRFGLKFFILVISLISSFCSNTFIFWVWFLWMNFLFLTILGCFFSLIWFDNLFGVFSGGYFLLDYKFGLLGTWDNLRNWLFSNRLLDSNHVIFLFLIIQVILQNCALTSLEQVNSKLFFLIVVYVGLDFTPDSGFNFD
jgi:hypothetical protein